MIKLFALMTGLLVAVIASGALVLDLAGCGATGKIIARDALCAAPDILRGADALAPALDGNDAGWNAAIESVSALTGLASQIGCDLLSASAEHLIADARANGAGGAPTPEPPDHNVHPRHLARLLPLVKGVRP